MNVFERRGDLIGMSAVSDVVNGWPGGIIQASRLSDLRVSTDAVIESVTADSFSAASNFAAPGAVSIKRAEIRVGNNFVIKLPIHSVSVITMSVNGG
jgi:hypothetical protein